MSLHCRRSPPNQSNVPSNWQAAAPRRWPSAIRSPGCLGATRGSATGQTRGHARVCGNGIWMLVSAQIILFGGPFGWRPWGWSGLGSCAAGAHHGR